MTRIDALAVRMGEFCEARGWSKDWIKGGCYLHLEASEFIESLRGKGDSTPTEEAGDVLFALFAILNHYGLKPSDAVSAIEMKLDKLEKEYREG